MFDINDPRDGGHAWCVIMAGGCVAVRVRQVDTSAIVSSCEYAEYMCIFQILRNMVLNADPGYIASWAAAMIASWDF